MNELLPDHLQNNTVFIPLKESVKQVLARFITVLINAPLL